MIENRQESLFKLHGIELISFSIQSPSTKERSNGTFEFNIVQEEKTNPRKNLIIVFTTINISATGDESLLAHLNVACGFEIPSFNQRIKMNATGDYLIPHDLNIAISRISIGTSRGILYHQLRGSYLQHSILPLLPIE
jgi:hypothetical protein